MDLEDEGWVNIPYDEILEANEDGDEKNFSRKYIKSPAKLFKPKYFDTPQNSQDFVKDKPRFEKQLLSIPTQSDHGHDPIMIKESKEITSEHEPEPEFEPNQDQIIQVSFKKENQFVKKKMGSPRLSSREPDMCNIETSPFQYEEKSDDRVINCSSPSKMIKQEVIAWDENNERLNFWQWGLSGIGAFCSLGMVAATVCIIMLGNGRKDKQQNRKLKIQIYSDNKRIKKVVQQANEAMSAMRGVPLVKAQITYGGYYESI
ncbi:uncharacterized protein LOC111905343 [Lactuca sativa]|uniref:DUF6821 domain-containing protein n=1 Tax=Lactuca sativa TaxID=4236 RepID=A0A9R1V4X9_LACSA|nr:uncharacterized protein LOC111905343 [Lactuca sativa]KAJ0199790.1 hypothetical protein LSAT_V11C600313070 [Lactuca sativa]